MSTYGMLTATIILMFYLVIDNVHRILHSLFIIYRLVTVSDRFVIFVLCL